MAPQQSVLQHMAEPVALGNVIGSTKNKSVVISQSGTINITATATPIATLQLPLKQLPHITVTHGGTVLTKVGSFWYIAA